MAVKIKKSSFVKVLYITIAVLSGAVGCAHRVLIKSEPAGARVRLIGEDGKPTPQLGTTPLDLKSLPGGDAAIIEIEKEGFLPKQIVVPNIQGSFITISTRLQTLSREFLAEKNRRDFAASLNSNLVQILKLQSLVLARKKTEVLALETEMREQWNDVSLFHSLIGNYYFLQGNFKEAKTRYEKALSLDPNNEEARSMLANVR